MAGNRPEVDKQARHACQHFNVFDDSIEVARIIERLAQMMPDFGKAGLHPQRGIPGAAIGRAETHRFAGLGIGKARIDETRMRNAMHEFIGAQRAKSALFRNQPPACGGFDFGEQRQFVFCVGKRRHDGLAQTRAGNEAYGAREGLAHQRVIRKSGHRFSVRSRAKLRFRSRLSLQVEPT